MVAGQHRITSSTVVSKVIRALSLCMPARIENGERLSLCWRKLGSTQTAGSLSQRKEAAVPTA
jgi:hypothetical protein